MSYLLNETGFSYSGISNIINNAPEHTKTLLFEINNEYASTKEKISSLQKQLDQLNSHKGFLVSSFIYAHKAMKLGENPLCFVDDNKTIVVEVKNENVIDYNVFTHTTI